MTMPAPTGNPALSGEDMTRLREYRHLNPVCGCLWCKLVRGYEAASARVASIEEALREIADPQPRAYHVWCDQQLIPPLQRSNKESRVRYTQHLAKTALRGAGEVSDAE